MNRANSRYLDVLTFRPSEGRSVKLTNNNLLLVDPIVLPELHHLQIDRLNEVSKDKECLFYPTGHKNKNMKRHMEESIRQYKTTGDIHLKTKTKTFTKSFGLKQKELEKANLLATRNNAKPRQTLFYTRPSDPQTNECKKLIQRCRNNEERMDDILGIKVSGLDVQISSAFKSKHSNNRDDNISMNSTIKSVQSKLESVEEINDDYQGFQSFTRLK